MKWYNYFAFLLMFFSMTAPPDLSGYSCTFPPSLPSHVASFCYRRTPWLLAKQGKAAWEFRRIGMLQRTDSICSKAQQVQLHWFSEHHSNWQCLCCLICKSFSTYGFVCAAIEIEKSQPVNIPDAAKRKKKKRTRATDSSTGTFDGKSDS